MPAGSPSARVSPHLVQHCRHVIEQGPHGSREVLRPLRVIPAADYSVGVADVSSAEPGRGASASPDDEVPEMPEVVGLSSFGTSPSSVSNTPPSLARACRSAFHAGRPAAARDPSCQGSTPSYDVPVTA